MPLDLLSFLIAGVCHDLGHDGYTNAFHSNALTERGIRYNNVAVQENYHAAETFIIMQREDSAFLGVLSKEDQVIFRKRVIGCILATDMAKHFEDVSKLKTLIDQNHIKQGANSGAILNKESDAVTFKSQQFILETCLHACDLS